MSKPKSKQEILIALTAIPLSPEMQIEALMATDEIQAIIVDKKIEASKALEKKAYKKYARQQAKPPSKI